MPSNSRSLVEYETNVTPFLMSALTDSGDATLFNSQAELFSEADGYSPDIRPDGVLTGLVGAVAVSGANDAVDVSAGTCYLAGVKTSVSAGIDKAITRPATNVAKVNSVTITSAGAIAVLPGTDGTDANFSEARGVAGSAPYIPVGSIELFQVRVTSSVAAPITADQIKATVGTHRETSSYPSFKALNFTGQVQMKTALPLVHTGDLPKAVYASYAEPIFVEQEAANDFVPVEVSHSVSSEQVYNDTRGSVSGSIKQGSFTAILTDGITDDILTKADQTIFVRYYQDRLKTANILTQAKLAVSRTFGAANEPKVTCTLSASQKSVERAS